MVIEKYKWYILGYAFYVSIVLASIWNERRDFWPLFIIWCITIPIALYVILSLGVNYLKRRKTPDSYPETVLDITNQEVGNNIESKNPDSDLIKSWPLLEFAKIHGKMQVGDFINHITKETFKSCIFTDQNGKTIYVSFYSKLGELTPRQIKEKRDVLKVGLVNTDKYVLYETWEGWNEVKLRLK